MRLVDSFLMELDQEAQTTKRVLERIPDDKLGWKPHPKSYSLGQLALHIASVPGNVAAAAPGVGAGGGGALAQASNSSTDPARERIMRWAPIGSPDGCGGGTRTADQG